MIALLDGICHGKSLKALGLSCTVITDTISSYTAARHAGVSDLGSQCVSAHCSDLAAAQEGKVNLD